MKVKNLYVDEKINLVQINNQTNTALTSKNKLNTQVLVDTKSDISTYFGIFSCKKEVYRQIYMRM